MKIIASIVLAAAIALSSGQGSDARYRFLTPTEMIGWSEVIAVVQIDSVENTETGAGQSGYTQRASAKIEQVIKGSPDKTIILVGNLKEKLCVPDWTLSPGKLLIFVRKGSDSVYISANSGIGLLPVKDGKVTWFPDMSSIDKRQEMPLATAVASIKKSTADHF